MKGRSVWWRYGWASVGTGYRVDALLVNAPARQCADIDLVERFEAIFGEGRGRLQLAGAKSSQRSSGRLQKAGNALKTRCQRYRRHEAGALNAPAGQGGHAAGILEYTGYVAVAPGRKINGASGHGMSLLARAVRGPVCSRSG